MLNFISQNLGSIIVGAVLLVIVFFVIKKLIRDGKNGSCSSCVGCTGCETCKTKNNNASCDKCSEKK